MVTGLVLLTLVVVGTTLHSLIPAIPLAAALAFGAALATTDAAAVTALAKDMRFGRRHEALLNGEALFNDVTGTVAFSCAIGVVVSGAFSLTHAGEEFALEMFGGLVVGIVFGFGFWLLNLGLRRFGLDNPTVHVVIELLTPFIIYLLCEQIHVGGVIAVVMAGVTISLLPHMKTVAASYQRLQADSVWKTLEFVLNGVIFVILGMQLPPVLGLALGGGTIDAGFLIATVLIITVVLELVRFLWILGMDVVDAARHGKRIRGCFTKPSLKGTLGMAFAGPKGGVTLALMLTIPVSLGSGEAFPLRSELLFLASGVIVCTMLLANFAVQKLVPHKPRENMRAYVDSEIQIICKVVDAIQEDAHVTGMVTGERSLSETSDDDEIQVDEPATAIVLKRYADRMREFLPLASKEIARQGKEVADRCDELYKEVSMVDESLAEIYDEESDNEGIKSQVVAVKRLNESVDDIQDAALSRELEFIKAAHRAGNLSNEHARELRNDVYVQQMTIKH